MGADVLTREQMKHSLDDWYRVMLQQNIEKATEMKEEIESKISGLDVNQDVLLYHALLNFRYQVLSDWVSIKEGHFNQVEPFEVPQEGLLAYYYHLFKALYFRMVENYEEASKEFEQAEKLLEYIQNPCEKAEFNYRLGEFYYHTYQEVKAIHHIQKAKEEFINHPEYQINVALCENIYGLCCVELKQFELAEESFNIALDVFQRLNHKKYVLMIRNNLGWLYGTQNLSDLAIRHASEVAEKLPKHYKAIFTVAEEYWKLGEIELAQKYIAMGIETCNELKNKEFQYRFMILEELNKGSNANEMEKIVLESISYFESKNLLECIKEYSEKLAMQFYEEGNHIKASKYFYINNKANKKYLEKGALK
ncbi:RapH N-terminal domain-containing protein [Bacillus thuringiensis]|uniref:response regulator aspartate phosphatase n=1 Tax=Bacillus thuringiensis TaxID=1428 RepID=UPI000A3CCCD0|nr:tetratricopeptide repeat protein [Bacillus thuringiensis]MED3067524.1 RapH N-terminal domain-containing protein [Bacillus thuringiensis]OUB29346.1 hypothetical protein BK737_21045 [Bacillus thuringiensis serovar palmanyolensis]